MKVAIKAMLPHVDSYYAATAVESEDCAPLGAEVATEICVIGAGMAGLSVALELAERGRQVVLIEANRVGWGASGRNGGFVAAGYAQGASELRAQLGLDHARALHELSREGVDIVAGNISRFAMEGVDTRKGALSVLRYDGGDEMAVAAETMRRDFGYEVEAWTTDIVREHLKSDIHHQGLYDRHALHIHPLNYCIGLARAAQAAGVDLYEGTKALRLEKCDGGHRVVCAHGAIAAEQVVLCHSAYGRGLHGSVDGAVLPVATYVVASQPQGVLLDTAIACDAAIADTRRAGDYYRRLSDGRLIWGGRITTQKSQPARLAHLLKRDIVRIYPQLESLSIEYAWSGLMGYAVHKMPIVAELSPGVWTSTAFGGHGLNSTAIAGRLVAAAIADGDDRVTHFLPFGTRWGGGPVGRIGTQAAYWWYQARDWMDERSKGAA
jgi:glycine/D-amino acid oxidase-like deaminating enzyme